MLDPGQVSDTRASLLGFLLYGTPQFLERLLQAFGADESVGSAAALAELLPGPHPVLRCLASVDAGGTYAPHRPVSGDTHKCSLATDLHVSPTCALNKCL